MTTLPFEIDPRVTFCELKETEHTLQGVADAALRPKLEGYARATGRRLGVTFPVPVPRQVVWGRTPLYASASSESATVSEVGFGEGVLAYDGEAGFIRVATVRDGYHGWVPVAALGDLPEPTHRLMALRAHVYAAPRVSAPRLLPLAYGAPLHAFRASEGWAQIALGKGTGYVRQRLLEPLTATPTPTRENIIAFASRFLEVPYVWGGVSAWGLDCSGLVQTVYRSHGVMLPRDSDQQAACGSAVAPEDIESADLIFFPGHVGIALSNGRFLHANAHHMCVTLDDFGDGGYGAGLWTELTGVGRVLP